MMIRKLFVLSAFLCLNAGAADVCPLLTTPQNCQLVASCEWVPGRCKTVDGDDHDQMMCNMMGNEANCNLIAPTYDCIWKRGRCREIQD
jgi:hypothetical protein